VWTSGALNVSTGRPHRVRGERKNEELFIKLLDQLRRTYRCHRQLHLAVDNDSSHISKQIERYVEASGGRIRMHPMPAWPPESNPMELVCQRVFIYLMDLSSQNWLDEITHLYRP
jgi:putative transposase